ncbi:hypothetical protein TNCV_3209261 [Trichonephila clavipes]|nr:hypothetical protein TNCV_3209261 [Trichonephila clavipes]
MVSLGHQFLSPTDLGREDEEMTSPRGGHCKKTSRRLSSERDDNRRAQNDRPIDIHVLCYALNNALNCNRDTNACTGHRLSFFSVRVPFLRVFYEEGGLVSFYDSMSSVPYLHELPSEESIKRVVNEGAYWCDQETSERAIHSLEWFT